MTPFRQIIRPGQSGRDVKAVKLAYRKMGIGGAGGLTLSKRAGPAFVRVTETVQRQHGLKADGVYGKATHAAVAPHFSRYCVWLYRTAKIRKPPPPPVPNLDAQAAAKKLLAYAKKGKYRDDSGRDLAQIRLAAEGKPVWSQAGRWVHLDKRILDALIYLIEQGHTVGTYAICSDHSNDGPLGHAGGHAVDVSSFDGVAVVSGKGRARTLELAKLLHGAPGALAPWQLICGGYGGQRDAAISKLTIPGVDFYGPETMAAHTNHCHLGYE